MVDRPKKPSPLGATPGPAPQPQVKLDASQSKVTAVLPTGESCEILLYGATVISWKDKLGKEKLWVSDAAKTDGTKAVRGGIPLVFPVFGKSTGHPATDRLPQHGFARTSRWEFLGKSTSESPASGDSKFGDGGVKMDFGLSSSNLDAESKRAWPFDFGLIYSVTLSREGLETSILVRNEGSEAWDFQVLLHTYFRVKDITRVAINGLDSTKYVDKVGPSPTAKSQSGPITISSEVDRVYSQSPSVPIEVSEGGKKILEVRRDNLEHVVVWNPWIEKAKGMGDFEPKDGWKKMVCVEAGQVLGWQRLEAGDTFEGSQFVRGF